MEPLASVTEQDGTLAFCTDACCYGLHMDRVELTEDCETRPMAPEVDYDRTKPRRSPNGSQTLVVLQPPNDSETGQYTAVVRATDSVKDRARFSLNNPKKYECGDADFLTDDRILVLEDVCAGPAGVAWIADLDGKRIAAVGGRADFGAFVVERVHAAGDIWAFLEEGGRELVYQNIKTGAVIHSIDLRAGLPDAVRNDDSGPAISHLIKTQAGEVVVAYGGAGRGVFTVLEPVSLDAAGALATGARGRVLVSPRCAQ